MTISWIQALFGIFASLSSMPGTWEVPVSGTIHSVVP